MDLLHRKCSAMLIHSTVNSLCLLMPSRLPVATSQPSFMSVKVIHDPYLYTPKTDSQKPIQMCSHLYLSVHSHWLHPDFRSPSCAAVLRPCILMALMVLHADLRSLKVNSLTSVAEGCDRWACTQREREAVLVSSAVKVSRTLFVIIVEHRIMDDAQYWYSSSSCLATRTVWSRSDLKDCNTHRL